MPAKKTPKPKTNPEPVEMITITVPKDLPKGLERYHDAKGGGWRITSKKGLDAFFEMVKSKAVS